MGSKQGFGTSDVSKARVYEDFDPHMEWAKQESSFDTLLVYLPGFLKDKLRIQITSAGKLRISGERALGQNKWRRFLKEFALSRDCDTSKISAKFEGGILYVKVPKSPLNTTTSNNKPPITPSPTDQKPTQLEKPSPMSPKPSPAPDQKAVATKPSADNKAKAKDKDDNNVNNAKEVANHHDDGLKRTAVGSGLDGLKPAKPAEKLAAGKTMSRLETYKKAIVQGLGSDRVKSPRALVNLVLAVLFVGVLALYVKNMFKSLGGHNYSNGTNNEHHEL